MHKIIHHVGKKHISLTGLIFFVALILLQVNFFIKPQRHSQELNEWVTHTNVVINKIQDLFIKIKDAELGQRGFFLTEDPEFLKPYYRAIGREEKSTGNKAPEHSIHQALAELRYMIRDNPAQQEKLDQLKVLVTKKLNFIQRTLEHFDPQKMEMIRDIIKGGQGRELMDAIKNVISAMIEEENRLLQQRSQAYKDSVARFNTYMLLAALITYGSLLATIILMIRSLYRITETEKDLHTKEADFRAAAEGGKDAFFIFRACYDGKGEVSSLNLEYMNGIAQNMLGISAEQARDMPVEEIFIQQTADAEQEKKKYFSILSNHLMEEKEYMASSGPLSGHFFQQQSIPLSNGIAIICRDITERKQVDRMKNEFVSTVSHELRTPLTSIRGSLGLITGGLAGPIPEQADNLLKIAYNNCERLVRLINDILDIEKIESGSMVFDTQNLALLPIIKQSIDANSAFAEKYGVHISFNPQESDPDMATWKVNVDSDRLIQVLTNLLSNAVKFSPENGHVFVRCIRQGDYARVEVEDKGKGIPKEFMSRIFDKFAQADSSDTRQKGGTGLGLNIVKALIEQMKGTIHFTSIEHESTVFYFTLPLVRQKPVQPEPEEKPPVSADSIRLLICEDEEDIAHFLSLILVQAGFVVDVAYSAEEAREKLEQNTYHAMTLDLMLPDMDGITFVRQLRAQSRFFELPIIVVSAKAEEGRKALNGDAVGILDWLVKPIDVSRLVDIVQNLHLRNSRAKILHVEDDQDIAQILKLSLSDIADIIWTDHLEEAKELIGKHVFDLAILDVGLSDGKGTDLLPLLGSQGDYQVPVVLFTALEVPQEISTRVTAALTKAKTSEEKLLTTIRNIIINEKKNMPRKQQWRH